MEKIVINIDSKFRNKNTYQNASKFTVNLDKTIKNITNIKLSSIEFPNIFSNIFNTISKEKKNNLFKIIFPINISNNIYSTEELKDTINLLLNKININMLYSNNKFIITSTNNFDVDFSNNLLGELLGFNNIYYQNINTITSNIIIDNININNTNNNFNIIYNIIIDDKYYTIDTLLNKIETLLKNINTNFSIIYDNIITIKIQSSIISRFNIDFNNNSIFPSLGYILGYTNKFYNSKFIDNNTCITSENIINIPYDNYIFIKINNYGNLYTNLFNNSDDSERILYPYNILGKIILHNNNLSLRYDYNNLITKEHICRQPINISKFDIELIDSYGINLNMLLIDYSITLEICYIYNSNLIN